MSDVDVAIIGGGPAGLAAALTLRRRGVERVTILEREAEAGGIPRHCGHATFGLAEFGWLMSGPSYARRLVAKAKAAGVTIRTSTTVLELKGGGELVISNPDGGSSLLHARRVLLASGVRETPRAARLVGGARPIGVTTTGALQNFIYLRKSVPFMRPVIIGTELVSFSALLTCRHAGIRPQAMIEENDRPTAYALFAAYPRLRGIPVRFNTRLVAIDGRERVTGVVIDGPRGQETIACDGVLFTGEFVPASELVRATALALDQATQGPTVDQCGRLSDPTLYAAGNVLRPVETSAWCHAEGRKVGEVMADDLAGKLSAAGEAAALAAGVGVKYVMPQRIAPGPQAVAHEALQLRVERPVRGRLALQSEGRVLWSRPIALRPERRYLVPLAVIAPHLAKPGLTLTILDP